MASQTPDHIPSSTEPGQKVAEETYPSLRLVLEASGYVVELTRPDTVLGRHSDCDVRLPLPDVSRRHCRFTRKLGSWFVSDLGSMNGVFVNGQRVSEAPLKEGDTVGIGGFRFEARFGELVSESMASAAHEPAGEHNIVSMLKPVAKPDPERRKAS
jgi:pSer/pThr/pTyr-binding forkhead associated (FHA) protein